MTAGPERPELERPDFERLESKRLTLRRLTDADVPALAAYRGLPEVARYQSWDGFDEADARALVEAMRDREPGQPGWFQYGIELKGTSELVGDLGLRVDDDRRQGEVGFTLAPAYRGSGLATEAVRAVLGLAFGALGLHRMTGATDPRNLASQRVLERAGLRREGHLVEALWFKGEWADDLLYAVLRREWGA